MAKKVLYVDDLTGNVIDEGLGGPVEFSFDGTHYTVDLGVQSKDKLRKALEPFIAVAEEVEAPRRRGRPAGSRSRRSSGSGRSSEELAAIREWLKKQGHDVSERGRVKQELIALFDDAHAPSTSQAE